MPRFISKFAGEGHHFIGTIKYVSQQQDLQAALNEFMKAFNYEDLPMYPKALHRRAWFIKTLELKHGDDVTIIHKLAIELDPSFSGKTAYISNYHSQEIEPINQQWYQNLAASTKPSPDALLEATGGHDISDAAEAGKTVSDIAMEQFLAAE